MDDDDAVPDAFGVYELHDHVEHRLAVLAAAGVDQDEVVGVEALGAVAAVGHLEAELGRSAHGSAAQGGQALARHPCGHRRGHGVSQTVRFLRF